MVRLAALHRPKQRAAEERAEFLRRLRANDVDLTSMYLESNGIGAAGAAQLAGALHDNTVLKSLHLECNGLTAQLAMRHGRSLKLPMTAHT